MRVGSFKTNLAATNIFKISKSREVSSLLDDTEVVEVSVVDGEIDGRESGRSADPESLLQLLEYHLGLLPD
jgi:hypothetical protein